MSTGMRNKIITDRLKKYQPKTLEDEENALKEILQEIALYALSTTNFFSHALFQGGTSLRILYNLPRFSEDLDFILKSPDENFQWERYMDEIKKVFELYEIAPEINDRSNASRAVKKLFLKDSSIGKILNLTYQHHTQRKLLIKLEIDTNPPLGSGDEIKFLDFPIDYSIATQDLASNFAGKCHALLCRPYVKGRDWFDFSWYVANDTIVNLDFLSNALNQCGPWKDEDIVVTKQWLVTQLEKKVQMIDWRNAQTEVRRFLNEEHSAAIELWSNAFFLNKIKTLAARL